MYTLHSILLDIAGHYYWTLLRWSLLHVRLAAQRGELAGALGAARLVARAQAAQLVLELVLSCLRISASTSDMRRSVASRVRRAQLGVVPAAPRREEGQRVHAVDVEVEWRHACADTGARQARAVTEPVVRSAWPPKRLCVGRWVARTWC